ncbi:MAG: NAD(+)/NADH kinase [Dehalococcoidales bacterium]
MERIGILFHPLNKAACPLAEELEGHLAARDISVWTCSAWDADRAREQLDGTELIITVGGDGTILRAAQVAVFHQIPITGVNLGKLGFMTELDVAEAKEKLDVLVAGEGWIDERAMLEAVLEVPDKNDALVNYALNDVVMARGEVARMVRIEARVDGEVLTSYRADGVILSTATGSTGYSLSAGGPILHPGAGEFLMLPILPHLSLAYTLVLLPSVSVELYIDATHMTTLSIDGHINLPVSSGSMLTVRKSEKKTRFLRIHTGESFYGNLEKRLRGKR